MTEQAGRGIGLCFGRGAFTLRAMLDDFAKEKINDYADTTVERDPDNINSMYVQGYDVYVSTNNSNGQYIKMKELFFIVIF